MCPLRQLCILVWQREQVNRVDFDAPLMVVERQVEGGITYEGAKVTVSEGTGLGIDRESLYKKVSS